MKEERFIECSRCRKAGITLAAGEPDRICSFCEGELLRTAGYWPTPVITD